MRLRSRSTGGRSSATKIALIFGVFMMPFGSLLLGAYYIWQAYHLPRPQPEPEEEPLEEPDPISPMEVVGYLQVRPLRRSAKAIAMRPAMSENVVHESTATVAWCLEHARCKKASRLPMATVRAWEQELLNGMSCAYEDCCVEWQQQ